MARVLVTAGAGSIGRSIVGSLASEGHEAVVLDDRELPTGLGVHKHHLGRANDRETLDRALEGCDHIFHLEWSGSVHRTTLEPLQTNSHNTGATLTVLESAKALGIPVTFASTCVYRGDHPQRTPESAPHNERSLYVAQKVYAENCVRAYAHMFGVNACSLRIFNVYGSEGAPFQIIPRIREAIRSGTGMQLTGDGGQMRDFIHVSDVEDAFVKTIGKTFHGEAINIGTGVGTSMLELVNLAMSSTKREIPITFVPAKGEEARYLIADPSLAHERLGFKSQIELPNVICGLLA